MQARLQHPHLAPIYEVGEADGQTYIAMALVQGGTLAQIAREWSLEAKVRLMVPVADAVHTAHRQGLIHRDLKPGNVLVALDEAGLPWPYVVDFGLARLWDGQSLTAPGQVMGSPAYMSPEQAQGLPVDPRTDVYGLGATLFELLAGCPPFQGNDAMSLLLKVIRDEPPRLVSLNADLPRELDAVVQCCLEKDAARRYPSAAHLRDDLQRFLDGEPVQARQSSTLYRFRKWVGRNRSLAMAAGAAGLVLLTLGGGLVHSRWSAARQERLAAELGYTIADIDATLQKAYLLPSHDIAFEKAKVRQQLVRVEQIRNGADRHAEAASSLALGRGHLALGEYERAKVDLERARALGQHGSELSLSLGLACANLYLEGVQLLDPKDEASRTALQRRYRDPALTHLRELRGSTGAWPEHYIQGIVAFCEERYEEALRRAQEAMSESPFFFEGDFLKGRVHLAQANVALYRGEWEASQGHLAKAEGAFRVCLETGRSFAKAILGLGQCASVSFSLARVGRRADPFEVGERTLEAFQRAAEADSSDATPRARRALILSHMGIMVDRRGGSGMERLVEARAEIQRALTLDPSNHKVMEGAATIGMIQGDLLQRAGEDPRPAFEEGARWGERLLEREPGEWGIRKNLGLLHSLTGEWLERRSLDGESSFKKAEAFCRGAVAQSPTGLTYWNLGAVLAIWGRCAIEKGADPSKIIEAALEAYRHGVGESPNLSSLHGEFGDTWVLHARAELRAGRDPEPSLSRAEEAYAKAFALDPKDTDLPLFRARLAEVRMETAQRQDAKPALKAAAWENLKRQATKAAVADPKNREPWLLLARGRLLLSTGKPGMLGRTHMPQALAEAHDFLQRAQTLAPKDPLLWIEEAKILRKRASLQESDPRVGAWKARMTELTNRLLAQNPAHREALAIRESLK